MFTVATRLSKGTFSVILLLMLNGVYFSCSQPVISFVIIGTQDTPTFRDDRDFVHMLCDWNSQDRNIQSAILKDDNILAVNNVVVDEDLANRPGTTYTEGSSSLTLVFLVNRDDTGTYECCLYNGNPLQTNPVDCSRRRSLNVWYLTNPICKPSENLRIGLQRGEEVTLSCLSNGNPSAILIWSGSGNYENSTSVTNLNGNVTSELTLTTVNEDINDIFTCTAANSYFTKNCKISVTTIWPTLTIGPTVVIAEVNESAEFTCSSIDSNPTWEWDTKPVIDSSRVSIATNVLRLTDITLADNDTAISCYSLSENRWFQASAVLFVGIDSSLTDERTLQQSGDNSTGWKAGFSIIFLIMIASIASNVFLTWKLREKTATSVKSTSSTIPIKRISLPVASKQPDIPGECYTDLQKPEEGHRSGDLERVLKSRNGGKKERNDYVYEVDVAAEKHEIPDQVYDYAENPDKKHIYANEKIGPRKK